MGIDKVPPNGTFGGTRRYFAGIGPYLAGNGTIWRHAMLSTILIVILILLLIGALPRWPHSADWGYYPGGGIGLVLIIVLILALMGRI